MHGCKRSAVLEAAAGRVRRRARPPSLPVRSRPFLRAVQDAQKLNHISLDAIDHDVR